MIDSVVFNSVITLNNKNTPKMKKNLLLLLSFLAISAFGQKALVVTTKDGGTLKAPVSKIKTVSFGNKRSLTADLWNMANTGKFAVLAHRCNTYSGMRNGIPENSIGAVEAAIKAGADMVEIDPRSTKDSVIVICHDETITRTTGHNGTISDMEYAEIAKYKLQNDDGNTEYTIPTLSEMLDAAKDKIYVCLDVKDVKILPKIASIVKEKGMSDQVCYFTNQIGSLLRADSSAVLFPWVNSANDIYLLKEKYPELKFVQFGYSANTVESISKALKDSHLVGLANFIDNEYTLTNGDYSVIDQYITNGIQYIQTDYSDLLVNYLATKDSHTTTTIASNDWCISLHRASSDSISFVLDESPILSYKNGNTMVLSTSKTTVDYPIDDIALMKFYHGTATGIEAFKGGNGVISIKGNGIKAEGLRRGTTADVFDAAGVLMQHRKIDETGVLSLEFDKPGLYIVKLGKSTIKILHK